MLPKILFEHKSVWLVHLHHCLLLLLECLHFPVLVSWPVYYWHFWSFLVSCFYFVNFSFLYCYLIHHYFLWIKKIGLNSAASQKEIFFSFCGYVFLLIGCLVHLWIAPLSIYYCWVQMGCSFGLKHQAGIEGGWAALKSEGGHQGRYLFLRSELKPNWWKVEILLYQGPAEFFCKSLDSKYFGLCGAMRSLSQLL